MTAHKHWRTERDADGIAWLHFDMAETSTNVLSVETIAEFVLCRRRSLCAACIL